MNYVTKKDTAPSTLPVWDLSGLFSGDSRQLQKKINNILLRVRDFSQKYSNEDMSADPNHLLQIIKECEQILVDCHQITLFVQLRYSEDLSNIETSKLYQKTVEQMSNIAQELVFFDRKIASISDEVLNKGRDVLGVYSRWIQLKKKFLPHYLDVPTEQVLIQKDLIAEQAWINMYDKIFSNFQIKYKGQTLNYEMARHQLLSPQRIVRRQVAKILSNTMKSQSLVLTEIMDAVLLNKSIEDRCRRYPSPISEQNMCNDIKDEDLERLVQTVRKNYKIAHRYYTIKAKLLKLKKLEYYDINAPLPLKNEMHISWNDGKQMVLQSYENFSSRFAKIAGNFFQNKWIDAQVRPHKASGAFCCHGTPTTNAFILMSYQNRIRDVMTLAHELGHGIHFTLSNVQPYLLQHAPLTVSETASVFGEMLTFQHLLKTFHDLNLRRYLLASKIEEKIATMIRQIAFHSFELELHTRRKKERLSYEEICQIWMQSQQESLGPGVNLTDDYMPFWTGILHFIHFPFYVYSYAFGDCLVNNIYRLYESLESDKTAQSEFVNQYIRILEAGNSKNYRELLQMLNLNSDDQNFWQNGIDFISGLVDKLEKII